MANYPQLDDLVGVWKLKDVNDALMGGYWRKTAGGGSRAISSGGFTPSYTGTIEHYNMSSSGNSSLFGDLSVARGEHGTMANFTRCVMAGGNIEASPNATK